MNLLWVENHTTFVRYARSFLVGFDVTIVPSLAMARDALARQRFEAVLVDFDLDDGKGSDLVRELAAVPRHPAIVAVSAHADGNAALLTAGADAICGKSEFARIAAVLTSVLG